MGVSAAIISGAVSVGTSVYQNQVRQKSKGVQSAAERDVLATRPDANAQAMQAAGAANRAETDATKRLAGRSGYASTILTAPTAPPPTAPARKTLLGM